MIRISFDNGPTMSLAPCPAEDSPGDAGTRSLSTSVASPMAEEVEMNRDLLLQEDFEVQSHYRRLRKSQEVGTILRMFSRLVKGSSRLPKLENIRYRVMRSLKKSIRRMLSQRDIASKGLLKIDRLLPEGHLRQFRSYCEQHWKVLSDFSSLQNGPCVDHRGSGLNSSHNTYNNDYMREVLAIPEVQIAYRLFAGLLFPGDAPKSMCRRFHIQCCQNKDHEKECEKKWKAFEGLVSDFLGAEVDLIDLPSR